MATFRAAITGGGSGGTGNRSSSAFTPVVGDLWVVYCFVSANTNDTPTCSDDNGGTYTLIDVANVVISTIDHRLSVFVRDQLHVNTTSTTVTVATGSNTAGSIGVIAVTGMTRTGSGAVRSKGLQNNQAAGTAAPALNQAALTGNLTIVAQGSADTTTTPPTNWTEQVETTQANPTIALEVATRDSGFTGTTITFGAASSTTFASHALELDTTDPVVPLTQSAADDLNAWADASAMVLQLNIGLSDDANLLTDSMVGSKRDRWVDQSALNLLTAALTQTASDDLNNWIDNVELLLHHDLVLADDANNLSDAFAFTLDTPGIGPLTLAVADNLNSWGDAVSGSIRDRWLDSASTDVQFGGQPLSPIVVADSINFLADGSVTTATDFDIDVRGEAFTLTDGAIISLAGPGGLLSLAVGDDLNAWTDNIATALGIAGFGSQNFTVTGSWQAPPGVTSVTAECWGGGGTGGPATGTASGAGGGAGGQYAIKVCTVVPGNTYTVTVATAAVANNTNPVNGGDSWFDSAATVIAKGGAGGAAASGATSAGGTGSTTGGIGDTVRAGGSGAAGVSSTVSGGGGGGAGSTGNGGAASGATAGTGTATGGGNGGAGVSVANTRNNGSAAGGGGSGGLANTSTNRTGGNGGEGRVFLSWVEVVVPLSLGVADDLNNWSDGLSARFDLAAVFADDLNLWSDAIAGSTRSRWLDSSAQNVSVFTEYTLDLGDDLNLWSDGFEQFSGGSLLTEVLSDNINFLTDGTATLVGVDYEISAEDGFSLSDSVSTSVSGAVGLTLTLSDNLNSWSDSVAGVCRPRWQDSVSVNAGGAALSLQLGDDLNAWADSLLIGYGLAVSDNADNLADAVLVESSARTQAAQDDLNNWQDGIVVGIGLALSDNLNNWADSASAASSALSLVLADSLNNWLDNLQTQTISGIDFLSVSKDIRSAILTTTNVGVGVLTVSDIDSSTLIASDIDSVTLFTRDVRDEP